MKKICTNLRPGPLGGVCRQHRGSPVDGVLAKGHCPVQHRRNYHRVSPDSFAITPAEAAPDRTPHRGAAGGSAIGTLVERSTRFCLLLHLPGRRDAATVAAAMIETMNELPAHLRRSLTWDQGREMVLHQQITLATGLGIYFCDPHSPWQRGSNENTNGLLRQYLPKGTVLSGHTKQHLDHVAELNDRPRQTLSWRTPAEALNDLLSNPPNTSAVATTP